MEHHANSPEPTPNLPARRIRHDGWTVERQERFLKVLASCGCITDACRAVGKSRESVHKLYNDPRAKDFRAAFDAALDCAMPVIETSAWERAVKGVARPVFYQGEQVGEYRQYNDRLTMFLLRYRRPHRYGAHLDRLQPPPVIPPPGATRVKSMLTRRSARLRSTSKTWSIRTSCAGPSRPPPMA